MGAKQEIYFVRVPDSWTRGVQITSSTCCIWLSVKKKEGHRRKVESPPFSYYKISLLPFIFLHPALFTTDNH